MENNIMAISPEENEADVVTSLLIFWRFYLD